MRKYKRTYQWQQPLKKEAAHLCSKKGCFDDGLYKAPISRYSGKNYQYFCLEHIKEFNKSWNYFEGMSDDQFTVEMERGYLGGETWPMGLHNNVKNHYFHEDMISDPFLLFEKSESLKGKKDDERSQEALNLSFEEQQALMLFELSFPFDRGTLRSAYRQLARQYHPDTAHKKADMDMIKKINQAYETLKQYFKRHGNV